MLVLVLPHVCSLFPYLGLGRKPRTLSLHFLFIILLVNLYTAWWMIFALKETLHKPLPCVLTKLGWVCALLDYDDYGWFITVYYYCYHNYYNCSYNYNSNSCQKKAVGEVQWMEWEKFWKQDRNAVMLYPIFLLLLDVIISPLITLGWLCPPISFIGKHIIIGFYMYDLHWNKLQ